MLQKEFTRLVSVDFSRCEQLRNRNLHVFATSKLKIEELVIGHSIMGLYSKPRITNAVSSNLLVVSKEELSQYLHEGKG